MKKTVKIDAELHKTVKTKAAARGIALETFVSDALYYWAVSRFVKRPRKRKPRGV
jgi:predicted HicB family RNase H-like nuclease